MVLSYYFSVETIKNVFSGPVEIVAWYILVTEICASFSGLFTLLLGLTITLGLYYGFLVPAFKICFIFKKCSVPYHVRVQKMSDLLSSFYAPTTPSHASVQYLPSHEEDNISYKSMEEV